jgi:hypothetical protein
MLTLLLLVWLEKMGLYTFLEKTKTRTYWLTTLETFQITFLDIATLSIATDGRLYGYGGGHYSGEYRINIDESRIELTLGTGVSTVYIEYVADEAMTTDYVNDPQKVPRYAEEALRAYIYYHLVKRKSNVPAVEKARARQDYYNERRLANARLKSFSKEEALKTIRKNFKQSPKA